MVNPPEKEPILKEPILSESIARKVLEQKDVLNDIGLVNGKMGAILYLYYASRCFSNYKYQESAELLLEECFDKLTQPHKKYHNNLAGFGIGLQYLLKGDYIGFGDDNVFESIDIILSQEIRRRLVNNDIGGFYNGAMSLLPYFLEREKSGYDIKYLIMYFIDTLIENSIEDKSGTYLKSNLFNDSRVYLTFPHGIGALILLLCKIYKKGYSQERIESIIGGHISFLIDNINDFAKDGYNFDDIYGEKGKSSLTLSYGDLGVGYAILTAGITFSNDEWYRIGLTVLLDSTNRRHQKDTFNYQANVAYGAAGLALFYHMIFELTSIETFQEISNFWKSSIYTFHNPNDEYLGFKSLYNQWKQGTNFSVNEGLCGIGMSLLELERSFKTDIMAFINLKQ